MERKSRLNYLVRIALLSALAGVLMLIKVPLAIFPEWLTIDISDVPAVIGALILGPLAGVIVVIVKVLINLMLNGTFTAGVGEFANVLIGISLVVPIGVIFKHKKTQRGALIGCLVGILTMTLMGVVLNYFLLVPLYAKLFGMEAMEFVDQAKELPGTGGIISSYLSYILIIFVPFNVIKGLLVTAVTQMIYKFVVPPLLKS